MTECSGACGTYVPPLHMGPPTCEERATARRLARAAFTHSYPYDQEVARGKKYDLDTARKDAQKSLTSDAAGHFVQTSPLGPSYSQDTKGGNATLFVVQQLAQEVQPDAKVPLARSAAEASGSYNATPTSRVFYDGPQIALDILA